jgi:hypothetical protein
MAMKAGDVCPQCKQGLLERTNTGLSCSTCDFEQDIEEVIAAGEASKVSPVKGYKFKGATMKISIDDPEAAEQFLQGLIVARSNNSSEYFVDLIDGINAILEPWRHARLQAELAARNA